MIYQPTYKDRNGELKKSSTWRYRFYFSGRKIDETAKTHRKTLARDAEKQRRLELERVNAGIPAAAPSKRIWTVVEVLKAYKLGYKLGHAAASVRLVNYCARNLERLIGGRLVADLTDDRIKEYQTTRLDEGAGPRTVDMEVVTLARAIGYPRSALWPTVKTLDKKKSSGTLIQPEQKRALRQAARDSRSPVIAPSIEIALCGLRPKEIRLLRWRDIDLEERVLVVPESKTEAGENRIVGLSPEMIAAIQMYLPRYVGWFKECRPEWFIFPKMRSCRGVDPTHPIGSFRRAWEAIRKKVGVTARFYDWRHTTITELLESGVPEQVVENTVGHVDPQVKKRYSHVRKQAALDAAKRLQEHRKSLEVVQELVQDTNSLPIQ